VNPDYRPIIPANPSFRDDGTLYSAQFDDVYASSHGGLEQARHVFLSGNGLPERWQSQASFVIVETGFGAGLNFLATWRLWKKTAPADVRLHFISVEKHPFGVADLQRIHVAIPEILPLARELHESWPVPLPGFHRLHFEGGRVTLTLLFGDAAVMLKQLNAAADAFFLDGFAPARNQAMWTEPVFHEIARVAKPGATLATYSVAVSVREGLSAAGFTVEKRQGFAGKREMLAGRYAGGATAIAASEDKRAIVIGAGLAGSTCAQRLTGRGWAVQVIEAHRAPAQEASGNPAGLIRPVISLDWNSHSRFTTAGFLYTLRHHAALRSGGNAMTTGEGGVLQIARDATRFEKQQRIVEEFSLPQDLLRTLDAGDASMLAGAPVAGPGWWFPQAAWADPASMCIANLAAGGAALTASYGVAAMEIKRSQDEWQVIDAGGLVIACAPVLVLANAHAATSFAPAQWLPLQPVRGQVSLVPEREGRPLRIAVCREGYVTPSIGGMHCLGASFNEGMSDTSERTEDHEGNLQRLEKMLPGFASGLGAGGLRGRVAFRAVAPDRLPVVGGLGQPGLFACLGLGSRGMTWSGLAAELVASQINGDPLPLERNLVAALAPQRFRKPSANQV